MEETWYQNPRFWVAVAFVIFFAIFGRKLWAALTAILDKRADTIRAELAAAQQLRQEAEAMLRDATAQRAEALTQAEKLLASAHAEAARLAAAASADAQSAATRREKMAMDRIAAAEKAAVDDVRIAAAEVAAVAAEHVIRDGLTPQASATLIDHAITELPAALRAA